MVGKVGYLYEPDICSIVVVDKRLYYCRKCICVMSVVGAMCWVYVRCCPRETETSTKTLSAGVSTWPSTDTTFALRESRVYSFSSSMLPRFGQWFVTDVSDLLLQGVSKKSFHTTCNTIRRRFSRITRKKDWFWKTHTGITTIITGVPVARSKKVDVDHQRLPQKTQRNYIFLYHPPIQLIVEYQR